MLPCTMHIKELRLPCRTSYFLTTTGLFYSPGMEESLPKGSGGTTSSNQTSSIPRRDFLHSSDSHHHLDDPPPSLVTSTTTSYQPPRHLNSSVSTPLGVDDTHSVGESRARLPTGDDHQRVSRLDELAVLAEADGVLDAGFDVLQPVGHALRGVDQREDAAVQVALAGDLWEAGDSYDGARRAVPGGAADDVWEWMGMVPTLLVLCSKCLLTRS